MATFVKVTNLERAHLVIPLKVGKKPIIDYIYSFQTLFTNFAMNEYHAKVHSDYVIHNNIL